MTGIYLFACVHNAGRSQMAAAWFNELVDPSVAHAISAGTQPDSKVHPEVVVVMKEVHIDLSEAQPTKLTDDLARNAKLLVTMGCGKYRYNLDRVCANRPRQRPAPPQLQSSLMAHPEDS